MSATAAATTATPQSKSTPSGAAATDRKLGNDVLTEDSRQLKRRNITDSDFVSVILILQEFSNTAEKEAKHLPTPEVAFRRAAALGKIEVLKNLIRLVKDLNVHEKAEGSQKTALDFAQHYKQAEACEFLRSLKPRRILKGLVEGQKIYVDDEDIEILGDVPKGVKIVIHNGDLIVRGSVADDVIIIASDGRPINFGPFLNYEDNISYLTPNVTEVRPFLKGNITILGSISHTTFIVTLGNVKVQGKNLRCTRPGEGIITMRDFDRSRLIEELLTEDPEEHYENVDHFRNLIKHFPERKLLQDRSVSQIGYPIVEAVKRNRAGYLQVLVNAGFNVNAREKPPFIFGRPPAPGKTALMNAIGNNFTECVEILLNGDAMIEIPMLVALCQKDLKELSKAQRTVIEFAYFLVAREEGMARVASVFQDFSSRVNIPLPLIALMTSLAFLPQNEVIRNGLVRAGVLPKLIEMGRAHFERNISTGKSPTLAEHTATATPGNAAAAAAAALPAVSGAAAACGSGAASDVKGAFDRTTAPHPLVSQFALYRSSVIRDEDSRGLEVEFLGHIVRAETPENLAMLKTLVERGILTIPTARSPLCAAASYGKPQFCNLLIENGADVNKVSLGRTALSYALESNHIDCARVFLNAGAEFDVNILDTARRGHCLDAFVALLTELNIPVPEDNRVNGATAPRG